MKIQALILLFPLAVLLTETGTITPVIKTTCENKCGNKKTKQDDCSNKNDTDKCNNKTECTSCPVCCVFILQLQYEWTAKQFIFKQQYRIETCPLFWDSKIYLQNCFSDTQPYYTFFILQNTKSSRKEIIFDSSLSFPKSVSEGRLFIKKFWKWAISIMVLDNDLGYLYLGLHSRIMSPIFAQRSL